jgi:hypothetical protein
VWQIRDILKFWDIIIKEKNCFTPVKDIWYLSVGLSEKIPRFLIFWAMWNHLYNVFTYIYSLMIEKDICDCQNISIKLLCVYLCLSFGDLFVFSVRVFSFYLYFCKTHVEMFWFHRDPYQSHLPHKWCCCYVYFRIFPITPIKSPAAILN